MDEVEPAPTPAHLRESELRTLIAQGESELVEFKREWPDLKVVEGKAKLLKWLLSLANTVDEGERGLILIGVDDEKRGGTLFGVASSPQPETVHQLVDEYATPHVQFALQHVTVDGARMDFIIVEPSGSWPHSLTRPIHDLPVDRVWVRRGQTTKYLPIHELLSRTGARGNRRVASEDAPITIGFLNHLNISRGELRAIVKNVTDEPVIDVAVMFDVSKPTFPAQSFELPPLLSSGCRLASRDRVILANLPVHDVHHEVAMDLATIDRHYRDILGPFPSVCY